MRLILGSLLLCSVALAGAVDGGSLTLGHHWSVTQMPTTTTLGTVSEMKAATGGDGALRLAVSPQAPKHLDPLDPPPKRGASFSLADGRPLIELTPACDVLIFGKLVDHDCKPLAAFGAWLTSISPSMVPKPGKSFHAVPGKGIGKGAHDGNLYFLAGDFSLTFLNSGRARIVMGQTASATLYDPAFALVVYDAFRHWLALSTANHQLERVVDAKTGTALKPLLKRGQKCCVDGRRVNQSECSVVRCGEPK